MRRGARWAKRLRAHKESVEYDIPCSNEAIWKQWQRNEMECDQKAKALMRKVKLVERLPSFQWYSERDISYIDADVDDDNTAVDGEQGGPDTTTDTKHAR
ncbi:Uncharacterized protein PBTT_00473 [Plasmodiophora brassicae]